ncbi:hypothetical protein Q75_09215 [Bacillus coahuilensis p1.1.43]|uniref:VOC domain-containing protein n=1 Tax=Bacillus coahuilensis p1.1.43 TaxID=1150625 RepID=A0A147K824_9BACI|nr:VOC family protein [Bacillus coahuilensis]KUP06308.1 hypothetical protein Q75_09215 [Bacillus coahuilensis p1.1.43]
MPHYISHIATIEIPVTVLERSIRFYTEMIGGEVEFKGEKNSMITFKKTGVPTIFLVQTEEKGNLSFVNSNNGVEHSIIDFYTPKLEEYYHWLIDQKVKVGSLNIHHENNFGGFGFYDPDGHLLSVTNFLHKGQ